MFIKLYNQALFAWNEYAKGQDLTPLKVRVKRYKYLPNDVVLVGGIPLKSLVKLVTVKAGG